MISQVGDRFTQMAFIELLGKEFFGKFSAFGGVAVIFTLPSIIFGPFTGPLIDSWRKKRVLLVGDFVRAVLVALLPIAYTIHLGGQRYNLYAMFAVALVVYIFGFFFSAARLAFVPLIVPRDELLRANSANMTLLRLATGIGTLLGGVAVSLIGWRMGFLVDALTYLASFVLILMISSKESETDKDITGSVEARIKEHRQKARINLDYLLNAFRKTAVNLFLIPAAYIADFAKDEFGKRRMKKAKSVDLKAEFVRYIDYIKGGIKLMVNTRTMVFVMTSLLVIFLISGVAFSVIVPTVQQTLKLETIGVTVLAAAAALGMFLGPFFTGMFGSAFRKQRLMITSFILLGLIFIAGGGTYLAVGLERALSVPWLNWTLICMMGIIILIAGVLFSAINISQDTIIQERIPKEARGRLFAWRETLASLAFVATAVPAGFIAERVSFEYVLVAVGGIVIVFSLAWMPVLKTREAVNSLDGDVK